MTVSYSLYDAGVTHGGVKKLFSAELKHWIRMYLTQLQIYFEMFTISRAAFL